MLHVTQCFLDKRLNVVDCQPSNSCSSPVVHLAILKAASYISLLTISLFLYWTSMLCYLRVILTTCRQSDIYHSLAFIESNMLSQQWSFSVLSSVQLKVWGFFFAFSTHLHSSVCCDQLEFCLVADSSDTGFNV